VLNDGSGESINMVRSDRRLYGMYGEN